ncbi:glycosyltransferase [Roseococcus pinisoli]|uniref:Glycosyltransferase n=1 Tax=Roseococcus pinisoli TaxID=2835040 RepID=A0ABS5QCF2_9PROT|nr:glycosyltransferase [Roseococcus pinisoli]MBS7810273.1 glycosyltransferase [Roseococcus pinisoli]
MISEGRAERRKPPRVTVVTPTYNRADLIGLTIQSVLSQTFRDFEYLIIDDGSSDTTEAVVLGFGDPRLVYLRHENRGEAATTNRGWAMARGEYFAVLSSDDLVTPNWLERIVALMDEKPELLVAYPDYDVIDGAGCRQQDILLPDYDRDLMIGCFRTIPGVGTLIRRATLPDMHRLRNPDYRHAPDLDSWLHLSLRGPFARLPERLASWRSHAGSITVAERNRARADELLRIASRFFDTSGLPADVIRLRRFAMAEAQALAAWILQDSNPLRAALHLRQSYSISPAQLSFVPAYWRREEQPDNRFLLRLLVRSLRHRTLRRLRSVAMRLPARVRRPLRRGAEQLGLVAPIPASMTPPAAPPPPPVESNAPLPAPLSVDVTPPAEASALPPAPLGDEAQQRLDALLPQLRDDLSAFRHIVAPLSPTPTVLNHLRAGVHRLATPSLGLLMSRAIDHLPSRIDHLLLLPWISGVGGSETVTARLIEALRRLRDEAGICIIAPDGSQPATGARHHNGIAFLGLSDIDASMDDGARQEILDRILIQRRPGTVHCINSRIGWLAFRDRARQYAADSALFANIYSDIRLGDGAPAALYYYDFLPHCIEHLAGVLGDNFTILRKAAAAFGAGASAGERMHVVRTPVIGLGGGDPARDLRLFQPSAERRSLWLSRIAAEKRLDIVARLAERLPARRFEMFGDSGMASVDLSELRAQPNVTIPGAFRSLGDIAMDGFDSYVFTTSGEGMPVALLEVAACGLPVIAPDIGGIGEFVTDDTGWLVPTAGTVAQYADALAQIEAAPEEARRRVQAAQALLLRDYSRDALDRSLASIPGYLGRSDDRH